MDHGPADQGAHLMRAGELDIQDGDRRLLPAGDGGEHAGIGQGGGIALFYQVVFLAVDAARDIGQQHQSEVDVAYKKQY